MFFGYMILTGALFPVTVIPMPFRYVSLAIPFTYFIDLIGPRGKSRPPSCLRVLNTRVSHSARLRHASCGIRHIQLDSAAR